MAGERIGAQFKEDKEHRRHMAKNKHEAGGAQELSSHEVQREEFRS